MLALDTNILVYAADNLAGPRQVEAEHIIQSAAKVRAALPEQCILEFLNILLQKIRRSMPDAATLARDLNRNFRVLLPPPAIIDDILRLMSNHRLNIWDARILAVCAANACTVLLTEDMQDGGKYGGVTVINPFNPANAAVVARVLTP